MSSTEVTIPHDWTPRPHQRALFDQFGHGKTYRRGCAVWHRRAGKDSCALNLTARDMFRRVGTYWHLFPEQAQARRAIWNGIDRAGRRIIDQMLPPAVRARTSAQEMLIETVNGSIWQMAGSDNFDSLVGSNPVGVVFSEWALVPPRRLGVPAADPGRERRLGALHLHPARPQPRPCHLPAGARGGHLVLREADGRRHRADHAGADRGRAPRRHERRQDRPGVLLQLRCRHRRAADPARPGQRRDGAEGHRRGLGGEGDRRRCGAVRRRQVGALLPPRPRRQSAALRALRRPRHHGARGQGRGADQHLEPGRGLRRRRRRRRRGGRPPASAGLRPGDRRQLRRQGRSRRHRAPGRQQAQRDVALGAGVAAARRAAAGRAARGRADRTDVRLQRRQRADARAQGGHEAPRHSLPGRGGRLRPHLRLRRCAVGGGGRARRRSSAAPR